MQKRWARVALVYWGTWLLWDQELGFLWGSRDQGLGTQGGCLEGIQGLRGASIVNWLGKGRPGGAP